MLLQCLMRSLLCKKALVRAAFVARRYLAFCLSCILISSCASLSGPEYERPTTPKKDSWSDPDGLEIDASEIIRPDWWAAFGDPYLDRLVDTAIRDSFDLKVLAARVEIAAASVGVDKAALLPRLTGQASAQKQSKQDVQYALQGSLSWELDVWGKVRKRIKAQEATFRATEADWRAGYLTLISDVSTNYFRIRAFDEQIAEQKDTLRQNEAILSIYEQQYKEGLVARTRVLQQQAEVHNLKRELVRLRGEREVAENTIATLLGIPAGELSVPVGALTTTVQPIEVPAGLPSELLARRPDIIAAEYRVLSSYELLGDAKLARLPNISLTGTAGASSTILSNLIKTWTLGIGPTINIPIFDPSITANIRINEAQVKAAEEEYRQTVIKAFEEVENAIVNLWSTKEQHKEIQSQIEALKVVRDQNMARLKEGMISQLEIFEVERSLLSAEQSLRQNHQQILSNTVTLYKALGGGWPKEVVQ